jgi:hypothetical protein
MYIRNIDNKYWLLIEVLIHPGILKENDNRRKKRGISIEHFVLTVAKRWLGKRTKYTWKLDALWRRVRVVTIQFCSYFLFFINTNSVHSHSQRVHLVIHLVVIIHLLFPNQKVQQISRQSVYVYIYTYEYGPQR